jgi:peptidoglycan hydrolase-like protein with peptidoglycan-binding domain
MNGWIVMAAALAATSVGMKESVLQTVVAMTRQEAAPMLRLAGETNDAAVSRKLSPQLVVGLDGAFYESYRPATIERIQQALKNRGLYSGAINGSLDPGTMQAIYAFQKAHYNLQLNGIPTPRTRLMLEQGSHTDPGPGIQR